MTPARDQADPSHHNRSCIRPHNESAETLYIREAHVLLTGKNGQYTNRSR